MQLDHAGTAAIGGDAWSRSAGLLIVAIAVVAFLFVGTLMLFYFGAVQTAGTVEPAPLRVQPIRTSPDASVVAGVRDVAMPTVAPAIALPARADTTKSPVTVPAAPRTLSDGVAERATRAVAVARSAEAAGAPQANGRTADAADREPVSAPAVERRPSAAPVEVAITQEKVDPPAAATPTPERTTSEPPPQLAAVDPAPARPPPVARNDPPAEPLPPVVLRPVSRRQPEFPPQALSEGVRRGTVLARLTVATDGTVSSVTIVSSNPPRLFDRAAERALAEWRFEPIAHPTTTHIELAFRTE